MKKIFLLFAVMAFLDCYPQKDIQRGEILLIEGISISYLKPRLFIDVANSNPVHFQIWKAGKLILNAEGKAKGSEFFTISKGKYKFVLYYERGKTQTKFFRI